MCRSTTVLALLLTVSLLATPGLCFSLFGVGQVSTRTIGIFTISVDNSGSNPSVQLYYNSSNFEASTLFTPIQGVEKFGGKSFQADLPGGGFSAVILAGLPFSSPDVIYLEQAEMDSDTRILAVSRVTIDGQTLAAVTTQVTVGPDDGPTCDQNYISFYTTGTTPNAPTGALYSRLRVQPPSGAPNSFPTQVANCPNTAGERNLVLLWAGNIPSAALQIYTLGKGNQATLVSEFVVDKVSAAGAKMDVICSQNNIAGLVIVAGTFNYLSLSQDLKTLTTVASSPVSDGLGMGSPLILNSDSSRVLFLSGVSTFGPGLCSLRLVNLRADGNSTVSCTATLREQLQFTNLFTVPPS